jgi:DNA-binding beta-propeller fold protein YncE
MILILTGENSFNTQWFQFVETPDFACYVIASAPLQSDLMIPNLFENPEGAAVDNSGNIFVTDAGKDSIFKFNASVMNSNHSVDRIYLTSPMVFPFLMKQCTSLIQEIIDF